MSAFYCLVSQHVQSFHRDFHQGKKCGKINRDWLWYDYSTLRRERRENKSTFKSDLCRVSSSLVVFSDLRINRFDNVNKHARGSFKTHLQDVRKVSIHFYEKENSTRNEFREVWKDQILWLWNKFYYIIGF